jgi:hypothetical protein
MVTCPRPYLQHPAAKKLENEGWHWGPLDGSTCVTAQKILCSCTNMGRSKRWMKAGLEGQWTHQGLKDVHMPTGCRASKASDHHCSCDQETHQICCLDSPDGHEAVHKRHRKECKFSDYLQPLGMRGCFRTAQVQHCYWVSVPEPTPKPPTTQGTTINGQKLQTFVAHALQNLLGQPKFWWMIPMNMEYNHTKN